MENFEEEGIAVHGKMEMKCVSVYLYMATG